MGTRTVRFMFLLSSVLFGVKVVAHGLLFFQGVAWVARLLDESDILSAILHPFNLPLLGCLLGLVSLIVYCRSHSKGIQSKTPCYQVVLPFVYVLAWQFILLLGWSLGA